ncbi:MAG: hypothetical protein M3R38_38860 [Actinomycetota bacterium]|nr:hypothetical protein [Actinomycetota bacterium]
MEGYEHCYSHDPGRANERRRNASKGGRSGGRGRPQTETDGLKREIRAVVRGVLAGEIPQGPGAVALQGYNTILRACEQERRAEAGHISPEEMQALTAQVVEVVGRHLHGPALRAFSEEIGALLGEGG